MAFLDAVLFLVCFAFIYFVFIPALQKMGDEKKVTKEDTGEVEKEIESAEEINKQANEVTAKAKKKAEDLLKKAEDLNKRI